jgi:hypothetical protein
MIEGAKGQAELMEQFHDFIADSWTILFSHPDDYVSSVSESEKERPLPSPWWYSEANRRRRMDRGQAGDIEDQYS